MIDASITLNGIDAEGRKPPGEMIFDGEDERVELVRADTRGTWSFRAYHADGGHEKQPYASFEAAFSKFSAKVAEAQEVVAHA